jgi:hypothetical protein
MGWVAEGADGPEAGAAVVSARGVDDAVRFLEAEHVGQRLRHGDAHALERLPLTRLGVSEEEPDAVERHADGRRGKSGLVLEVEEVVAELGFGELVGRTAEVPGELAYFAEAGLLGAEAEAGKLQVLAHALTEGRGPGRGHEKLLSQWGSAR